MKTISVLRWGTYTNVVRNINLIRLASRNFSIINLSRRYGHVILVSGHLVLTGVSGSQHGCPIPKKYTVNQGCMSLCQPVIWSTYGRHVARLRCRRAYAPTGNTASHDNHEKINSWVSFCLSYMGCLWGSAWWPFGPPELRYNARSALENKKKSGLKVHKFNSGIWASQSLIKHALAFLER